MGYKQELDRSWSGFQNFAISFTIISVLAGCFTTYYQGWNNGGPVAISWGWPIISLFILIISFCMAELASAYPTAGGIYWWASKLGGPGWGWFTGWFNLLGLIAILASVDYFAGQFLYNILGLYNVDIFGMNFADGSNALQETFLLFFLLLCLHVFINIRGSHLVAVLNGVSVWWHVIGVAVIVAILAFAPSDHASINQVFTDTENNSGFSDAMFWWYVLPLGFLLTQYTITGFDASAHISEETHGASMSAARGVWQSVFYSAVIGYIVLLAITFAASDTAAVNEGGGTVYAVFGSAMTTAWTKSILIIAFIGQVFCGMSCMTSASRMMYAFSRDGAVPGSKAWSKVDRRRIPFNAVMGVAVFALILTLPALKGNSDGRDGRVHRGRLDRRHRALRLLGGPDLPALASRGLVRARALEPREQVQVDGPDRAARDPHRRRHLLQPAVQLGGCSVGGRLRLEPLQLHAGRHRRAGDRDRSLVGAQRQEVVHRAEAHGRRRSTPRSAHRHRFRKRPEGGLGGVGRPARTRAGRPDRPVMTGS